MGITMNWVVMSALVLAIFWVAEYIAAHKPTDERFPDFFGLVTFRKGNHGKLFSGIVSAIVMAGLLALVACGVQFAEARFARYVLPLFFAGIVGWCVWRLFEDLAGLCGFASKHPVLCRGAILKAAIGLGVGWFFWPGPLTYSVVAVCIACMTLSNLPAPKISHIVWGVGAIVAYDLWGIWGAYAALPGGVAAAGMLGGFGFLPPLFIVIPHVGFLGMQAQILGLGDIILPGLVVRTAIVHGAGLQAKIGYIAGLGLATAAAGVMHIPVPALPFIATLTALGLFAGSRMRTKRALA